MESRIKLKATVPEMNVFFETDSGVRFMEIRDSRYTAEDLKSMPEEEYRSKVFAFFVIYRHKELERPLSGTFTIAGLQKRLGQDAQQIDLCSGVPDSRMEEVQ